MNRTTNSTIQNHPRAPLHPRQDPKEAKMTTGPTSRPSWTPSDPGITVDAAFSAGSDASLMPWHQPLCHRFHSSDKFLTHEETVFRGGALGNRGAPLSRVTEVRTSILFATVSPCALRGTCPPHWMRQAGANRSGSSKGCGPCAAKRLSRGTTGPGRFPDLGNVKTQTLQRFSRKDGTENEDRITELRKRKHTWRA